MPTAKQMMEIARSQIGYKESPAGSNKTKYGKEFGLNGEPWCSIFEWWCGKEAAEKYGGTNPIPHNANAAYAQDEIVSKKGGSWIMKKNTSKATRKAALKKYKAGDVVCFDFGRMNAYRQHTGLVERVDGDTVICIEGNTSKSGSQSNGGMVCRKERKYTDICSCARPKYTAEKAYTPSTPYNGELPKLPSRGYFVEGDEGTQVGNVQNFLNWIIRARLVYDKKYGELTADAVIEYENQYGLAIDGHFGKECLAKAKQLVDKYAEKTNAEEIMEKALLYAYPAGTDKSKYAFKGGKPREAYTKALDKIFPKHKSWKKEIRTGASCAVFVATAVRASGVDTSFKCDDPPKIFDYMLKSSKWKKINSGKKPLAKDKLKHGDIIVYEKPGANGDGHILFYKEGGYQVEANFGRCYPHTQKLLKAYTNEKYISNTFKRFGVFRCNDTSTKDEKPVSETKTDKPTNTSTATKKQPKLYVPTKGEKCYDLSAYQGNLSVDYFKGLKKKGITCIILRSSYTSGSSFTLNKDKCFDNNIKNAIKAGMHIGIYHFSQARTEDEAKKEEAFCIQTIKPYIASIDLPVAFDWESYKRLSASFMKANGKTKNTKIVNAFCDAVKKAGYEPMVYASLVVFNNYLSETIYKTLKIWVAQYYKECQYRHPYYLWQYTSNNGKLDEDVFGSQDTKKK